MTLAVERAKAGRRPFTIVEIDLDYCSLTYGIAPCQAALGVTGSVKCYNTLGNCQDPENYSKSVKTYTFCSNVADVPRNLDALPFIVSAQIAPTKLSVGAGLGERGSVTVVLQDGLHNDRGDGFDKYVSERTYDPLKQGTFWGRFFARHRYFLGRQIRVRSGYLVQNAAGASHYDAENFQTRTYFLEKLEGPDSGGRVTILAKDILKLADDQRALAPKPSQGRLSADLAAGGSSATLTPTGIGSTYAAGGKIRINSEVITYTRSGDVLTLTARGQHNTVAADHSANDLVQECLEFVGQQLHAIANTLCTTYAGIPSTFIPLSTWQTEDAQFNVRNYNALITEPTGVNKLLQELSEQGPAYFWWDEVAGQIVYRALRPAGSAPSVLNDSANFVAGSVAVETRQDLRISEVLVNFGLRDPTQKLDEASNYRVSVYRIGETGAVDKQGQARRKVINSRWLSAVSRTFAEQLADSILQRFDEAPRQIKFSLTPKDADIGTGSLVRTSTKRLQNVDGDQETISVQVLSASEDHDTNLLHYTALEERFVQNQTSSTRTIVYSAPQYLGVNLRTDHDTLYAAPTGPVTVRVIIESSTIVGSTSAQTPGFDVGDWPASSSITIVLKNTITGIGGVGGAGASVFESGYAGQAGGVAFHTRVPVTIDASSGTPRIWGGGGGGGGGGRGNAPFGFFNGGGGGGGGQGRLNSSGGAGGSGQPPGFGANGSPGASGTLDGPGGGGNGPGAAGNGGAGGASGQPGSNGEAGDSTGGGAGGAAGAAIDGLSYITFIGSADIRGPQIN